MDHSASSQAKRTRRGKSVSAIGCLPTDGTDYTGRANTTASGLSCQVWSDHSPHDSFYPHLGDHNYCRSPDGDDLWCYTTDPGRGWDYCDVPDCVTPTESLADSDCQPSDGTAYTGNVTTTVSGRTCKVWSSITSYARLGQHNFCRDPTPETPNGVWCFTTDPKKLWEFCEVPWCVSYTKGNNKPPSPLTTSQH